MYRESLWNRAFLSIILCGGCSEALAERAFTEKLGWPDFNVSDYISKLLVEFTHTDNLYRIKSAKGARVEAVVDLLYESEVTHEARSFEQEREVHRHIGDFTLFMAGSSGVSETDQRRAA